MLLKKVYEWIADKEIEVYDEPNNTRAYAKSFGLGALYGVIEFMVLWGIGTYIYVIVKGITSKLQ